MTPWVELTEWFLKIINKIKNKNGDTDIRNRSHDN